MKALFILAVVLGGLVCATFADETNFQSPIDGKSYRANWQTYYPTNPSATNAPASRVQKQGIRLLSTQEEFGRGIDVAELADFIRKTERVIDQSLGATNDTFELVIQTCLTKDKRPIFKMGSKGNVSQDTLQKIYDGFGQLPDYRSRADDLRYEVTFNITKF
jgi:hypothetical protein